jgi:hypothetical protein
MFNKNTNRLKDNLKELKIKDQDIQDRKNDILERIEESQELDKKNELLEQLKKMSEKLNEEGMLDKLNRLMEKTKQDSRSLERLLELTKRFFVEKKSAQIINKLDSLENKQEKLSEEKNVELMNQNHLNEEFNEIRKDLKDLKNENQNLAQPMDIPNTKNEEREIEQEMKKASAVLKKKDAEKEMNESGDPNSKNKAARNQKLAAKKMNKLSKKMQEAMAAMQGEMLEENIDDLRAIIENLLTFSFDQEDLMASLKNVDGRSSVYPVKIKKQQILKEYFEHIDDSLYTLSLRMSRLSSKIQKDLADAHYNIDKSLENMAENRMQSGMTNQQYTMTAANNLADMLSDLLNALQNPGMGSGKGKGNNIGLPDIIKKQGKAMEKMKRGLKNGKKPGKRGQMSAEQYEIYKEQNAIKNALQDLMKENGKKSTDGKKAIQQMEELEKELLDKGFNNDVLERMMRLEHELLKLEEAEKMQGVDNKRRAETNTKTFEIKKISGLQDKKLNYNSKEILDREPLPLRSVYKKRVKVYFKKKQSND